MSLLEEYGIQEDPRFVQARREARATLLLVLVETVWVFGFATWGARQDPSEYTYLLGVPLWLLWAFLGAGVVFPVLGAVYALRIRDCELTSETSPEDHSPA